MKKLVLVKVNLNVEIVYNISGTIHLIYNSITIEVALLGSFTWLLFGTPKLPWNLSLFTIYQIKCCE